MQIKRIKRKIGILIVLFAVIYIISFFIERKVVDYLERLYVTAINEQLEEQALQYKLSFLYKIEADLQTLEALAGVIQFDPEQDILRLSEGLQQKNNKSDFVQLGYWGQNGDGFIFSPEVTDTKLIDVQEMTMELQSAIEIARSGEAVCSDFFYEPLLDSNVLAYVVPVYQENEIVGVLAAAVTTEVFSDVLSTLEVVSPNGVGAILKDNGDLLVATIPYTTSGFFSAYDSERLPDSAKEQLKTALEKDSIQFFQFTSKGKEYYACTLPLEVNMTNVAIVDVNKNISAVLVKGMKYSTYLVGFLFIVAIVFVGSVIYLVKRSNKQLEKIAYTDKLTKGNNKEKFLELLNERWSQGNYAVVIMNIRQFKFVNEMLGVNEANRLLLTIHKTLEKSMEQGEFHCRDVADSFIICLKETQEEKIRKRLLDVFAKIDEIVEQDYPGYRVYFYCGVATTKDCVGSNDKDEELMRLVKLALNHAKQEQRTSISFYDAELHKKEQLRNYIESHMEQALEQEEFQMYLQPKKDLKTGKVTSAEALVRWITEGKQMIYPDQFIPIFEQNKFCIQLDFYMVEQACKQIRKWMDDGKDPISISVNQTKLLFYHEGYVEKLMAITEKYNVLPKYITLEILEGLAMENVEQINACIQKLRDKGFRVSMDDFGSGYSSLNTLGNIKIDELKLDRVFLKGVAQDLQGNQYKIMKMILSMANELNISTVAEGVETLENEQMIKELDCAFGQGYYYSKPITVEEFEEQYLNVIES